MRITNGKKKAWSRPLVNILIIKKDTFSGSAVGPENAGKTGFPAKT